MFIDEVKIFLRSGKGGNGCTSFRREKFIPEGGPDGGNGGRGGHLIFVSNMHMNTLLNFRYKQHFYAQNGEGGKGANRTGKSGADMKLEVPVGTQIFDAETGELLHDFIKDREEYLILTGGKGGAGNACFKSSKNRAPTQSIKGEAGEELVVRLKLKLISDVGLVGLPNAGKSTFLSRVTSATPKIADYPFTTLIPNLGVVFLDEREFVVADIPGLIEGAHLGHGLGDKFLKHIERCGILLHLIDSTSEDVLKDYKIIRNELESYSKPLFDKLEIVVLTKIDGIDPKQLKEKIKLLSKKLKNSTVFAASSHSGENVQTLLREILQHIS